jgi:hypothetical protein
VFFANPDTGHASLLYHRYDGRYGLIDTDGAVLEQ